MRQFVFTITLLTGLAFAPVVQGQSPEIQLIDNKLTIRAEAVPLGRLLGILDQSTGMTSKVPPELANRNISVQFADLSLNDGVRKIFEGQRLDYIYIGGRGIFVAAASLSTPLQEQPAFPSQPAIANDPFNQNPFNSNPLSNQNDAVMPPGAQMPQPGQQPGQQQGQQQPPAMIQTPFGPIPNPRANQGAQPGGNPQTTGQQNPFIVPGPQNTPNVFGAPTAVTPSPLGDSNVFGSPQGQSPLGGSGGIPGLSPSRP